MTENLPIEWVSRGSAASKMPPVNCPGVGRTERFSDGPFAGPEVAQVRASVSPMVSSQISGLPSLSTASRCDLLIVEDEPVSRRAMQVLMTAHGFASRAVGTAEEALRLVERDGVPLIVLVDLHLPGMNGIEFIRRMERASATVIPVLITAASAEVLEAVQCNYPVQCMRKPLEFSRLITLLRERVEAN